VAVLAAVMAGLAMLLFVGAEKAESYFVRRAHGRHLGVPSVSVPGRRASAFAVFGGASALALLVMVAVPKQGEAEKARAVATIDSMSLARRVFDAPWKHRVIDIRSREACAKARVPGSECVPRADLGKLGLEFSPGARDLILVGAGNFEQLPAAAAKFRGRVLVLEGGFPAWKAFVLDPPAAPAATASAQERTLYAMRAGFNKALTGKAPPPPPPPAAGFKPPPKKPGGGCN
jgi:hypothetical protein